MKLKIRETRESFAGRSVRAVYEDHCKCGCGSCDMVAPVAWFEHDRDADLFARVKTISDKLGICQIVVVN